MITTVGELIEALKKYDEDDKLRVIDSQGFTLMSISKVKVLDGRVTIFPEYSR